MKEKLEIKNISEWEILDGSAFSYCGPSHGEYVIHLEKNNRFYSVCHTGEWIKKDQFSKYKKLYFKIEVEPQKLSRYKNLINAFSTLEMEESLKASSEFIKSWENDFVKDNTSSFWTYLSALYEELYPKEIVQLEELSQFAIPIYERSFYLAGYAFYLSVKNGIFDLQTLREIFLVSLNLDCGLADPTFHFDMYYALEQDRCKNGSGEKYLINLKYSFDDIRFYQFHAMIGFQKFNEVFECYIQNKRLVHLIKTHHEGDELTCSNKMSRFECDDLEMIIIILNKGMPFQDSTQLTPKNVLGEFARIQKELKVNFLKAVS